MIFRQVFEKTRKMSDGYIWERLFLFDDGNFYLRKGNSEKTFWYKSDFNGKEISEANFKNCEKDYDYFLVKNKQMKDYNDFSKAELKQQEKDIEYDLTSFIRSEKNRMCLE